MTIEETPPLKELQERFSSWRKHKPRPNAYIPRELWRHAEELARKHGVSTVAKALEVNVTQLRNKIGGKRPKVGTRSTALEASTSRSLSPDVIEIASINISAEDLPRANAGLSRQPNPNIVLTLNNGAVLNLYQALGPTELAALINAVGGLECSN